MKLAETVTFGGSGLDRAAQLRGNLTETDISKGNPLSSGVARFWL